MLKTKTMNSTEKILQIYKSGDHKFALSLVSGLNYYQCIKFLLSSEYPKWQVKYIVNEGLDYLHTVVKNQMKDSIKIYGSIINPRKVKYI